jgi:hypothetical protein
VVALKHNTQQQPAPSGLLLLIVLVFIDVLLPFAVCCCSEVGLLCIDSIDDLMPDALCLLWLVAFGLYIDICMCVYLATSSAVSMIIVDG